MSSSNPSPLQVSRLNKSPKHGSIRSERKPSIFNHKKSFHIYNYKFILFLKNTNIPKIIIFHPLYFKVTVM